MAIQTSTYLKSKFETGDFPTQNDFGDVIDTMMNGLIQTPKLLEGTISQNPAQTLTSGLLLIGAVYTITSYVSGDDFTNVGADNNSTGVSFIATGDTPTTWSHSSQLDYDGAPYWTSTNIVNDYGPFINMLSGNPVFTQISEGVYNMTLTGAFPNGKASALLNQSAFQNGPLMGIYCDFISEDSLRITTVDLVNGGIPIEHGLYNSAISIKVWP